MKGSSRQVVLAYSGGLDTTVILHWLARRGFDVIAVLVNLGQKTEDQASLLRKAKESGATTCRWIDVREEFVREFVFPAVWANALYEGRYHLGTALARPLISKVCVASCRETGATHVAHGATGKGNDQVRFELALYALMPDVEIISPWRDDAFQARFQGRSDLIAYAKQHDLPVAASAEKPYSMDDNLLHISYEAGILEDPNTQLEADQFLRTTAPEDAPDAPERVAIAFEQGCPVGVDGEPLGPAALLDRLNRIAGRHGVGRVDMVESRTVGMKSRGVYETPGGTLLYFAHRDLEGLTLTGSVIGDKEMLMPLWARRVYEGYWYDPAVLYLTRYFRSTQEHVTGEISIELFKGNLRVVGRESPTSVYDADIASMDAHDRALYDQRDASGFIRLHGLPLRMHARREANAPGRSEAPEATPRPPGGTPPSS